MINASSMEVDSLFSSSNDLILKVVATFHFFDVESVLTQLTKPYRQ